MHCIPWKLGYTAACKQLQRRAGPPGGLVSKTPVVNGVYVRDLLVDD